MSSQKVAALYVDPNGVYSGRDDVDLWDEERDARLYAGPWPVVAHPPCNTWSLMANCRPEIVKGDDGGCFKAALDAVRTYGGVLEHPAHTRAWAAHGLPTPLGWGCGWTQSWIDDGWTCWIDQRQYGHAAPKPTWLYYVGPPPPELLWGKRTDAEQSSRSGRNGSGVVSTHNHHHLRAATPPAFAEVLLDMARSCAREALAGDAE